MERIVRLLRLVFRNIYYYRVDYIRTFVVIRLFQVLIVLPITSLLFMLMLNIIDVQSVTEQNIWQLLKHPLVLTVLAFIVLIFLIFIYYEMGFLMLLAYHQQRAIPYTLKGLWQRLNQKVLYFIAIEQYFVTERLIEQAKQQQKQLFVWTVNDSRSLQKYLEYNIDGIITNHPDEANNLREVLNINPLRIPLPSLLDLLGVSSVFDCPWFPIDYFYNFNTCS